MPYLNDDELTSLHKTIDKAEEELSEAQEDLKTVTEELETAQNSIDDHDETLNKEKKSKKTQNIILSVLLGIASALAFYFYNNSSRNSNIDINEIKQVEATRVLDSINSLNIPFTDDNNSSSSIDESVESLQNNINGEKIYSVQVGAFTKNRYTLLSETLAGISSDGDLFKYSIGLFKTLGEAQDFRRELVQIGFDDAFVASYIDGVRQEIEHPN